MGGNELVMGQITPEMNSPYLSTLIRRYYMTVCDVSWLLNGDNNENGGDLEFCVIMLIVEWGLGGGGGGGGGGILNQEASINYYWKK